MWVSCLVVLLRCDYIESNLNAESSAWIIGACFGASVPFCDIMMFVAFE